jgi:uncharacterized protein (DUF983 family)
MSAEQPPSWLAEPSITRALFRGATRRCPRCGKGKLFKRWFRMTDPCPRCNLAFERENAAFLGSMTLNYAVTAIAFVIVLIVGMVITVPDIAVWPILAASFVVIMIVPFLFYPFSKTLWSALDYLAHRA